jgi:DNA-binding beta-propeller fold protein YncE
MFHCLLVIIILCWSICPAVLGQLLHRRVDPSSLEEGLTFDTNEIPLTNNSGGPLQDLNFSPNVVFSPDSRKAFVSYPGSDKVLVFDHIEGEPLEPTPLIEVPPNPALITLTPDGKKIAVVSLFLEDNLPQSGEIFVGKNLGAISIIDVETLAVQTLNLTEVFFSLANNIVFSADSKTGFVASSGTDQILRFDVESATEITPRLEMIEGTRPSSITMSPDFSFFVAVLVGSNALPQQEVPDSLQVIDTGSFTVTRSIVPTVEDPLFPPHSFVAGNTLAMSADGKYGLIADQELSSASPLPETFIDHALLLDLETGDTVQVFEIGGLSGPSFLVPGGKNFVTLSGRTVAVTNIQSQEVTVVPTPPFLIGFRATSRPAFSSDGSRMFVAAAFRDFLLDFDINQGVFTRFLDVGPGVLREANGIVFAVPSGPLDLAWSPDRTLFTVVKFNANVVDVFRDTRRFWIPRILSNQEFFTGITLANNSPRVTTVTTSALDTTGRLLADDPDTEDPVDFVQPEDIVLGTDQQTAFTIRDLLQATPDSSIDGWLLFDGDESAMASFFFAGDRQLRRLDGGLANFRTSTELIFPEVRVRNGFATFVSLLNPNLEATDATMSLFSSEGELIEEISSTLPDGVLTSPPLREPDPEVEVRTAVFTEEAYENFVDGYVRVSSETGVLAFENYFDDQRLAGLNGIPVGPDVQLPTTLYIPEIQAFAGSETFVNLINSGTGTASLTLSLKGNQGGDLAAPLNLQIEAAHSVRKNIVELFNLVDQGALSGWILIESDIPGIVGNAQVNSVFGQAMTSILLQGSPMASFVFSHVVQRFGISTRLILLNPGPATATVQVEVYRPDGSLLDSLSLSIAPSQRDSRLLKEFFPQLPDLSGGSIQVSSDQSLVGLELFFSSNPHFMASVPAQPVDP